MKKWSNPITYLELKKKAPRKFRYQMLSFWQSAGEAFEGWWPLGGGERGGPRWGRTHGFWFLGIASVGFGDGDDFRFPHQFLVMFFFWFMIFACRGKWGYINFPLWLESWRAVSKEACPSQQQQWEFPRWGRNSAGGWCLVPPWLGWDMWWHTSVHSTYTGFFHDFHTGTQLWLVINCHSQD